MLGTKTGTFNITISIFALSFIGFALVTTLITGILFAKKLLQSDDNITRLKGKIIMIAFISFVIGAVFDAAVPLNAISLIVVRLVLISSAFSYYLGFLMPEKLSNWIIKEELSV
jgi:prolipoprotein diacylglyceryltransferase